MKEQGARPQGVDILEEETKNIQNNKIFIDIMKKINRTL